MILHFHLNMNLENCIRECSFWTKYRVYIIVANNVHPILARFRGSTSGISGSGISSGGSSFTSGSSCGSGISSTSGSTSGISSSGRSFTKCQVSTPWHRGFTKWQVRWFY